jgi:hypothetical protein
MVLAVDKTGVALFAFRRVFAFVQCRRFHPKKPKWLRVKVARFFSAQLTKAGQKFSN